VRQTLSVLKILALGILALSLVFIYFQGQIAVVQNEKYLLGTYFRIKAQSRSRERAERAVQAAFEQAERLAEEFSRTGAGSLGELNRRGFQEPVKLSDDVITVFEAAQKYRELSQGAFDPTIGKVVDSWGFTQNWDRTGVGHVPSPAVLRPLIENTRDFSIDSVTKTGQLSSASVEIDFGGIAKGYIVDRVVEILQESDLDNALVDAGGNIRVFNSHPRRVLWWEDRRPFRIAVQHPRDEQKVLGVLEIWGDRALATSGDYQRCFFADVLGNIFPCRYADEPGKTRYHHIIDPKTGMPARGLISVTILAPTATEADALSTAVFVLGPEKGLELVERLENIECIMVTDERRILKSPGLADINFPTELP
jgi:thiamine biosynthesis lipoprotein